MPDSAPGQTALDHLERALAHRPARDADVFAAALVSLADFRDEIIISHRRDGGTQWRATLDNLNGVISVVLAAEFPLGEVPWEELEAACRCLQGLVSAGGPQ